MLKINVITLFPQLIKPHLEELPFKKAIENKELEVNIINLRDFALDNYGTVDGKPYGGGTGMILMVEPIHKALESIKNKRRVVLLSPKGKRFNQQTAREFSKEDNITFICGRYEGIDHRVEEYVTDIVSIGNYILSGGELPALTIMESVTRLLPGILDTSATTDESFENDNLEYPQYTRPEIYDNKRVPKVLLSGNHAEIEKWKKENSIHLED